MYICKFFRIFYDVSFNKGLNLKIKLVYQFKGIFCF